MQVSHCLFFISLTLFIPGSHRPTVQPIQRFYPSRLCMSSLTVNSDEVCALIIIVKGWMVLRYLWLCGDLKCNTRNSCLKERLSSCEEESKRAGTPGRKYSLLNTFVHGWMPVLSRRNYVHVNKRGNTFNISSMRKMKPTISHLQHHNQKSLRLLSRVISTNARFKISKVPQQ